jgi:hypothetical protein
MQSALNSFMKKWMDSCETKDEKCKDQSKHGMEKLVQNSAEENCVCQMMVAASALHQRQDLDKLIKARKSKESLKQKKGLRMKHPISTLTRAGDHRQKGLWKRGVVETKSNTVKMMVWVHKECDIMDEDALLRLQGVWEKLQQKDKCSVRMDDLEWEYWMGT